MLAATSMLPAGAAAASSSQEPTTDEEEHDEDKEGEESFVEWIRRATGISEVHMKKAGIYDWVSGQKRRKFKLAGHIARWTDGRWSNLLLYWGPDGHRRIGRPRRRWEDLTSSSI